jgi:hypothetical protein
MVLILYATLTKDLYELPDFPEGLSLLVPQTNLKIIDDHRKQQALENAISSKLLLNHFTMGFLSAIVYVLYGNSIAATISMT